MTYWRRFLDIHDVLKTSFRNQRSTKRRLLDIHDVLKTSFRHPWRTEYVFYTSTMYWRRLLGINGVLKNVFWASMTYWRRYLDIHDVLKTSFRHPLRIKDSKDVDGEPQSPLQIPIFRYSQCIKMYWDIHNVTKFTSRAYWVV